MTRSGIALVALRIVSVYVAVNVLLALVELPAWIGMPELDEGAPNLWWGIGAVLVLKSLLAWVIWRSAPRLARSMGEDEPTERAEDRLAIGALTLRIVGILLLDQWFGQIVALLGRISGSGAGARAGEPWLAAVVVVSLGTIALWLVVKPTTLSQRLFGRIATGDGAKSALIQAIAFSVLGLVMVVHVLPDIAEQTSLSSRTESLFGLTSSTTGFGDYWTWPSAANFVRLAVGILLFAGGGALASLWQRLRTAGVPNATPRRRVRGAEGEGAKSE